MGQKRPFRITECGSQLSEATTSYGVESIPLLLPQQSLKSKEIYKCELSSQG